MSEEYVTTTTPEPEEEPAAPRAPRVTAETAQTVGRRKEAVVRVRITPGTGQFLLNGKSLEEYFPNKVHQQLKKLKVYAGPDHPHTAQKPEPLEINT